MAKINTRIISLSLPTALDDLHCNDGEIEHGELIFPLPEENDDTSDESGGSDKSQNSTKKKDSEYRKDPVIGTTPVGHIPAQSKLLLIHRPSSSSLIFTFVQLGDGRLAYIRNPLATVHILSEEYFNTVISASALNDFIIFNTSSVTVYALYQDSGYIFLSQAPETPKVHFRHIPCAIPPYSLTEESFPSFSVETPVPEDQAQLLTDWLAGRQASTLSTTVKTNIRRNVTSAFSALLSVIENAGLYISPVMASAALESREGSLFRPSPPVLLSSQEKIRLNITAVSYSDGIVYLRITLTRRPFRIAVSTDSLCQSAGMKGIFPRISFFQSREVKEFPDSLEVSEPAFTDTGTRGFYPVFRPDNDIDADIIHSFDFYHSDSVAVDDETLSTDAGYILPCPAKNIAPVSLPYFTHIKSRPADSESIAGKLLNIGGTLSLPDPFPFHQHLGDIKLSDLTDSTTSKIISRVRLFSNGTILSRVSASDNIIPSYLLNKLLNAETNSLFIFYPDNRAFELTIDLPQVSRHITLPLKPHPSGCGAFWWSGISGSSPATSAGRLISTAEINGEGTSALIECPNRLGTSITGNPMIECGCSYIADSELLGISTSLKALSSGQLGDFPLYAFSNQGIHALKPTGDGGFEDVQLICRDIPVSPSSIIPLPDSTAFISNRGLMILSSSKVSLINGYPGDDSNFGIPENSDKIAYHYASGTIIIQRDDRTAIYDIDNDEWRHASFDNINFHPLWPELYAHKPSDIQNNTLSSPGLIPSGNIYKMIAVTTKVEDEKTDISGSGQTGGLNSGDGNGNLSERPDEPVFQPVIKDGLMLLNTRPLKLTGDYTEKKPVTVSLIWPDGKKRPFRIYGSSTPSNNWHIIGRSVSGNSLRLRGSGWKFFKIEIWFPVADPQNPALKKHIPKPIIRFSFVLK